MNLAEIGGEIRRRRKYLKLSQQELADLSEVNINTVVNIESGKGNPLLITVLNICKVLGLTISMQ